jgi:hypothetical protein
VEWISKAWKEAPVNIIPESFLKCCLSNVEDGTQGDVQLSSVMKVGTFI